MRQKFSSVRQLTLLENQTRGCHTPGSGKLYPLAKGLRGNQRRDAKKHWVSSGHSGDPADVRFTPESRHMQRTSLCPLWAKSGHSCDERPLLPFAVFVSEVLKHKHADCRGWIALLRRGNDPGDQFRERHSLADQADVTNWPEYRFSMLFNADSRKRIEGG